MWDNDYYRTRDISADFIFVSVPTMRDGNYVLPGTIPPRPTTTDKGEILAVELTGGDHGSQFGYPRRQGNPFRRQWRWR